MIGRMDPRMRRIAGFGDRFTVGVTLGANAGRSIVTMQWGVCGVAVRKCVICHQGWRRGLYPNYFGQSRYSLPLSRLAGARFTGFYNIWRYRWLINPKLLVLGLSAPYSRVCSTGDFVT